MSLFIPKLSLRKNLNKRLPLHIKIPLNDIKQATNNFAYENIIEKGAFGVVYKGKLSGQILAFKRLTNAVGLQKSDFYSEVMFRSTKKHQSIISLVGFCDEDDEMILVLEHQTNGSLDMYLSSPRLTWWMRVCICQDIARGLEFLHNDPQKTVLGDLKSSSIHLQNFTRKDYLQDFWNAKIGLSKSFVTNKQLSSFKNFSNLGYVDPLYMETGRVTKETDMYSFGVILFEVLCGRQATTKDEETGWFLSRLACHHYENGTLTDIIDPILRLQMKQGSLNVFSALAYRCLNMDPSIRPTARMAREKLLGMTCRLCSGRFHERPVRIIDHMRIPLSDIGLATRKADLFHFDVQRFATESEISEVSMAELLEYPRRKSTVFIKSLDHISGQRTEELLRKISYVSHENLVKIFGFSDEDDERILVVYEYASNGSLDEYIRRNDTRNSFPWVIRLQICLDVARGLKFLHNDSDKHRGIIHGNIKSSNILINRDGVGMIGDFRLSNHNRLTKEYDVYSFGLVLFEVLSGTLTHCEISIDDPQFLPKIVKHGFVLRKRNEIIDAMLKKEFEKTRSSIIIGDGTGNSINIFASVAYECFRKQPEDRPTTMLHGNGNG